MLVHSVWDVEVDDAFLEAAKATGTVYCPTLVVMGGYKRLGDSALSGEPPEVDDPNGCVDAETLARVAETARVGAERVNRERHESRSASFTDLERNMASNLKRVHGAGIPVVMGTDAGNPLTLHGPSVHSEMEAMQAAGLAPMEVLVASTRGGALAMGRLDDIGTVEAGKIADLLVVGADPTRDVSAFRDLRLVVRGGVVRSQEELRAPSPSGE
jgi:imidazolonepropionase-like amidohydrolase